MSGIRKRPLGKIGLEVTEVGLGGAFICEGATAHDEAIRVVHRALELGVNYFDTAPLYGNSQEVLGEALQGHKGRWDWRTGPYHELDAFKVQLDQTLRALRRNCVDILYIHEADWRVYWQDEVTPRKTRHICADGVYDYDNAPATQFLVWAKEQGMAKHLGISGNNAHHLAKVLHEITLPVEVVLVASQYSLIRGATRDSTSCHWPGDWAKVWYSGHLCSRGNWPFLMKSGWNILLIGWTTTFGLDLKSSTRSIKRPGSVWPRLQCDFCWRTWM